MVIRCYLHSLYNVYIIYVMSVLESVEKLDELKLDGEKTNKEDSVLDKKIRDLEKEHDDLLEQKRERESKKTDEMLGKLEQVHDLILEMEQKDKLPSHAKNMEVYRNSKNGEAVEECIMYMHRALGNTDTSIDLLDISDPTKVTFIENIADVNTTEGEPGKPQVFVKKIQKEKLGWFGSHKRPRQFEDTDEVMVIIKLNNASDGNRFQNTMVEAVVKTSTTEDGKLAVKMGLHEPGLYRMESQQEFSEGRFSDDLSYDAKMRRGDMTLDQYHAKYKKAHGETLQDFHKKRDKALEKDPRYNNSKQEREEFIDSIPDQYTNLLEAARKYEDQIVKELYDFVDKQEESFKQALEDQPFQFMATEIVDLVKEDDERERQGEVRKNDQKVTAMKKQILRLYPDVPLGLLSSLVGR
jgi:hypothetical protein